MSSILMLGLPMIGIAIFIAIAGHFLKSHPHLSNLLGTIIAVGILVLFATAFGGAGALAAIQAVQQHKWEQLCIAVPFILVGGAFAAALIFGGPAIYKAGRIKAAHPNEPWLWDSDWATGKIPDHNLGGAVGAWVFAAIWCGFAIPASIGASRQYLHTHDNLLLIVMLFPAVGIWLVFNAIRATARVEMFGKSIFSLETLPASPGGTLAGTIHIAKATQSLGPVLLRLNCLRTSRSGKNSTTTTIWEDERQIDHSPVTSNGLAVPVYFQIPHSQPPCTTDSYSGALIAWRLDVTAPASAVSYNSKFKIPVFASAEPIILPPQAADAVPIKAEPAASDMRGITVSRLADGGCVLHFAPGRNVGMAAILSVIGAAMIFAGVMMPGTDAPLIAELVVWFFAITVSLIAINNWLFYSTITARRHSLEVERGMLMFTRHRSYPAESVNFIEMNISSTMNEKVYYALVANVLMKKVALASGIPGKIVAEKLVAQIEQALGRTATKAREDQLEATNITSTNFTS